MCSRSRLAYPGGASVQLDVDISGKSFLSAAGKPHEVLADINFSLGLGEVGVVVVPSLLDEMGTRRSLGSPQHFVPLDQQKLVA